MTDFSHFELYETLDLVKSHQCVWTFSKEEKLVPFTNKQNLYPFTNKPLDVHIFESVSKGNPLLPISSNLAAREYILDGRLCCYLDGRLVSDRSKLSILSQVCWRT